MDEHIVFEYIRTEPVRQFVRELCLLLLLGAGQSTEHPQGVLVIGRYNKYAYGLLRKYCKSFNFFSVFFIDDSNH